MTSDPKVVERVAMEICWREFPDGSTADRTYRSAKGYWKIVAESKRDNYRHDAKVFLYWSRNIPALRQWIKGL